MSGPISKLSSEHSYRVDYLTLDPEHILLNFQAYLQSGK